MNIININYKILTIILLYTKYISRLSNVRAGYVLAIQSSIVILYTTKNIFRKSRFVS